MKMSRVLPGRSSLLRRGLDRDAVLKESRSQGKSIGARTRAWLCSEEGAALVELTMVLPILLAVLFGLFTFGTAMINYQVLTNAVNQGGMVLQQLRLMPGASDPCAAVASAVIGAAPSLTSTGSNGIQLTVKVNNAAFSQGPNSASGMSCTGAATYLGTNAQATSVTVTASYPCKLTVYGVNYAPGCTLHASVTEQMQ
jgi:Flp pilus assembly protein TadG